MSFCVMPIFALLNVILYVQTRSYVFWNVGICECAFALVMSFIDQDLEKKITRVIVLAMLLLTTWQAYHHGSYINGIDWEIVLVENIVLIFCVIYDSLPAYRQTKTKI